MKKRSKAEDFLRAMSMEPVENLTNPSVTDSSSAKRREKAATRIGLKHIGGYFDPETVERIAVLRARLDLNVASPSSPTMDNTPAEALA